MAGQLTIDTLKASSGVLATQNGMTGIAKAWVRFAGASGTISSSFNVSSVTRSSTGTYAISFTTTLSDANYSISGAATAVSTATPSIVSVSSATAPTTSALTVFTQNDGGTLIDASSISVQVHGA